MAQLAFDDPFDIASLSFEDAKLLYPDIEIIPAANDNFSAEQLTKAQKKILCDQARFRTVVAGRRFGKTTLAISELILEAQSKVKAIVWYVAPTVAMAKDLVWEELKEAVGDDMIAYKNETYMTIKLKGTGSTIALKGADKPDRLRGKGLDFVVFDEAADIKEDTWFLSIRPALSDKQGKALLIGTPKGFNWFYDFYARGLGGEAGYHSHMYTTAQGGNVTLEEIESAKQDMNPKQFAQEYEASFENLSNTVYSCFSIKDNVDEGIEDLGGDIYIGMDFNVNPMSAVVCSLAGNQLHAWDEIEIPNGNTEEMCEEIKKRYPGRRIYVAPDPSGKARKTSAPVGQTDFSIIKSYGFKLIVENKAPPVVDRINEVNALCMNAAGIKRFFVSPKCEMLIKCMTGLTYKDKTSIPDKSLGLDHMTDAIGYLIHMKFPIIKKDLKRLKLLGT